MPYQGVVWRARRGLWNQIDGVHPDHATFRLGHFGVLFLDLAFSFARMKLIIPIDK